MCDDPLSPSSLLPPVQENSQNAPLVHATLETLLRFLNWIPLGYIFETKLISTLVYKVSPLGLVLHNTAEVPPLCREVLQLVPHVA